MKFEDITRPEVIQFIQEHLGDEPASLMLAAHKYPQLPMQFISTQIASRQKGKSKVPEWYDNTEVIFPHRENLEQASSQTTATFKARYLSGSSLVDLTGGTGIDTYYLSKNFETTTYVEPNEELCKLATHNFAKLDAPITVKNETAEQFLDANTQVVDWIFIDPSRRDDSKSRVYALEDCAPNVLEIKNTMLKYAKNALIKASPMLDIKKALSQLSGCYRVQVVAVDDEVKELLFYLRSDFTDEATIEAWNISESKEDAKFSFLYSKEVEAIAEISDPLSYLYEPNSALMKAGPYRLLSQSFGLKKLHQNTHLYTSNEKLSAFPGRAFKIEEAFKPSKKEIRKRFPDGKVNVVVRNYPMGANEIKQKFRLKDGGEGFLFFTTLQDGSLKALKCSRLDLG